MSLPAPNYTQVPNLVLDSMPQLKPAEFKLIMAICRNTFGYHHASRRLSISFLSTATGLSRQSVIDACKALIDKQWIERHPSGQSWEYSVTLQLVRQDEPDSGQEAVKNFDQSDLRPVQNFDQCSGGTSQKNGQVLVKKLDTINKELKKDLSLLKKEAKSGAHEYQPGLTPYEGSQQFMDDHPWIEKWDGHQRTEYPDSFVQLCIEKMKAWSQFDDSVPTRFDAKSYLRKANFDNQDAQKKQLQIFGWWEEYQESQKPKQRIIYEVIDSPMDIALRGGISA